MVKPKTKAAHKRCVIIGVCWSLGAGCSLSAYTFDREGGAMRDGSTDVAEGSNDAPVVNRLDVVSDTDGAVSGDRPDPLGDVPRMDVGDSGAQNCPFVFDPNGIYVSPTAPAGGDGTPDRPATTLAQGIAISRMFNSAVLYVDQGMYNEPVSLVGVMQAFTIQGGVRRVGGVWSRDCSPTARTRTVVQSTTPTALRFVRCARRVEVSTMTLSTMAVTPAGESAYGVFVDGIPMQTVVLDNIAVTVSRAGVGAAGPGGVAGMPTVCNGIRDCSGGGPGFNGFQAASAPVGQIGQTGYVAPVATSGANGTNGFNGVAGPFGVTRGNCFRCAGVAGGVGIDTLRCAMDSLVSGDQGTCGCAGSFGTGGAAGQSGGAAIGIFVGNGGSDVSLVNGSLVQVGNGGPGGAGGVGGLGGAPTVGRPGGPQFCAVNCITPNMFACYLDVPQVAMGPIPLAGGVAGTIGGRGGAGGAGGHGAGGPSYGIVAIGSTVTVTNSVVRRGVGGAEGGPGGVPGASADRVP